MGLERIPNKIQNTMLNLEKSILQRERGFFAMSCCCMSQISLKRMLSAGFGLMLINVNYFGVAK